MSGSETPSALLDFVQRWGYSDKTVCLVILPDYVVKRLRKSLGVFDAHGC